MQLVAIDRVAGEASSTSAESVNLSPWSNALAGATGGWHGQAQRRYAFSPSSQEDAEYQGQRIRPSLHRTRPRSTKAILAAKPPIRAARDSRGDNQ